MKTGRNIARAEPGMPHKSDNFMRIVELRVNVKAFYKNNDDIHP